MNVPILPAGSALLWRVLNASGEPIDRRGRVESATPLPLSTPESLATIASASIRLLETGIKVIDLLTPLAYGSTIGLLAGFGLGKEVLVSEILHNLFTRRQAIAVVAGMRETTYEASSLYEMVREIEAEDRLVMFFEQTTEDLSVRQRLLHAAVTTTAYFEGEGREVVLVIDGQIMTTEQMARLRHFSHARGIPILLLVAVNDLHQPVDPAQLHALDVLLSFSQERARQGLWPAIDPLASHSQVLESDAVSSEHRQIARSVREMLKQYYALRERANDASLNEDEQRILTRGERIDRFLSQPFTVAEIRPQKCMSIYIV